jgi:hypothetical protein
MIVWSGGLWVKTGEAGSELELGVRRGCCKGCNLSPAVVCNLDLAGDASRAAKTCLAFSGEALFSARSLAKSGSLSENPRLDQAGASIRGASMAFG